MYIFLYVVAFLTQADPFIVTKGIKLVYEDREQIGN